MATIKKTRTTTLAKPSNMPKNVSVISDSSNAAHGIHPHPRIAFIRSVKFVGLGMDKTSSSLDRISLAKARNHDTPLELDLKISLSVLVHESDHFIVGADFELTQTAQDSGKSILSISATFSARFNLVEPASSELVQAFAGVEARLIFFPYIRHFVSDTTYRMTNEPIVLPLTSELDG